jgi:hypothetical protein
MIEVLKKMVEALEWCHGGEPVGTAEAIRAGKQAIAELESQKPVKCERCKQLEEQAYDLLGKLKVANLKWSVAHPWVGLTNEEIAEVAERIEASDPTDSFWRDFSQSIETKLKEKNT